MERILLAEDDGDIRNLVRLALRINGLGAEMVTDGVEAVAAAEVHAFELILLDRQMPMMDGLEAAARIRESAENAQTPILFLSGESFDTSTIENSTLLQKPFTIGELMQRIKLINEKE